MNFKLEIDGKFPWQRNEVRIARGVSVKKYVRSDD